MRDMTRSNQFAPGFGGPNPGSLWAEWKCSAALNHGCKSISAIILLLGGLGCQLAGAVEEGGLAGVVKKVKPAVVTILADNPDLAMPSMGAGFFIGRGRIVTARHVLAGAEHATVRTPDGATFVVAGIAGEDRARDLAILALEEPAPDRPSVRLAGKLPSEGETVFSIGTPLGFEWSVSVGVVSALRDTPGAGTMIQHTTPVSPGSSGGPVFNTQGEVVGVQVSVLTTGGKLVQAGENLNFASPSGAVAALKSGTVRSLVDCAREVPSDWHAPINKSLDGASLRFVQREDYQEALPFFLDTVKQLPNDAYAWFRVGLCREHTKDIEGAIVAYREAVRLQPEMAPALNNLGIAYLRQNRREEAAESLEKAVHARPGYGQSWINLGDVYLQLHKNAEAADACQQALKTTPDSAEAHYTLGVASLRLGQREKARDECQILVKLDPDRAGKLNKLIEEPESAPTQH